MSNTSDSLTIEFTQQDFMINIIKSFAKIKKIAYGIFTIIQGFWNSIG